MPFYDDARRTGRRTVLVGASLAALALGVPLPVGALPQQAAPWLGVGLKPGPMPGVVVDFVFRKSPAEAAGIRADDLIVSADGVALAGPDDLVAQIRRRAPGETIALVLRRGGKERLFQIVLAAHPGQEELVRRQHVGNTAADLPGLEAAQGSVFTAMKQARGDVVLLEFFASWCVACRAQVPQIAAWHRRLAARGLRAMGITDEPLEEARKVASDWRLPYAVASDRERKGHRAYRVGGIPALFVIDRAGVVRDARVGFHPAQQKPLETLLEQLLAEKK
jgi:peroxiredoxin